MIFQEKCFSCYSLLCDQVSVSDWLYFLRYWAMCLLQLFVNQVVLPNFDKRLKHMRQKIKYLEERKELLR